LGEEVSKIVDELHHRAFFAGDGSASMISISYVPIVERYQFQPINPSLYDGSSGIALFLAARAFTDKDQKAQELALALLRPLAIALDDERHIYQYFDRDVIGGAAGWGGIVYAFTQIAEFLRDPQWHHYAAKAAAQITPERIEKDKQLDIIAGAPGAILGLLKRYRTVGDQDALARAVFCGEYLIRTQEPTPKGGKSWHAQNEPFLTGFSHGAAGMPMRCCGLQRQPMTAGLKQRHGWQSITKMRFFQRIVRTGQITGLGRPRNRIIQPPGVMGLRGLVWHE
jgi:lantibiotic modifying enzyme